MFTGIIETVGIVSETEEENTNVHFWIKADFIKELKIDQSVAHNGVCLTIVEFKNDLYRVTAIKETIDKSNLGQLKIGDKVNLERCMLMNGRLDGHIVQGHVDQTAVCTNVQDKNGSWEFSFRYKDTTHVTVEKGSICINGVSLTVFNSQKNSFSVAIIPYTYEYTNFSTIQVGDTVNLEFDIIGKYVAKLQVMDK